MFDGGFLRLAASDSGDYANAGLGILCFMVRDLRAARATFGRADSVKLPVMKNIGSRACERAVIEVV